MSVFSSANVQRAYQVIGGLLFLNYALFMVGYFLFPDFNLQYKFYIRPLHILVLPGIALFAAALKEIKEQRIFQLIILYMLYMLLTGLWSAPFELYKFGQKAANAVYILSFIVLTHFLRVRYPVWFDRMLRFSVLFAAGSAAVALLVFYSNHAFPDVRAEGLGSLTNVNEFANVYAIYALLSAGFVQREQAALSRALWLVPIAIFLGFAWFGQSRTALVCMTIALSAFVVLRSSDQRVRYAAIPVATVGVLATVFPEVVAQVFDRGEGLRPQIWAVIWEEIKSAPIVGNGIISQISVRIADADFETSHNAYLQVLWQGGLVGFGLFVVLLGAGFGAAWRWGRKSGEFTLFCMLLFATGAMMTGVDTLIARPRDQWVLFWFPLALLISYQGALMRTAGSQTGKT